MANITEVSQWESVIRQIENGEAATGGADGLANVQAKQLANRTKWLKDNYLPLSGGELTGSVISKNSDVGLLTICGGKSTEKAAHLKLFSGNEVNYGKFYLNTGLDESKHRCELVGHPDGRLEWAAGVKGYTDIAGSAIMAKLLAPSGYIKYASGLLFQWGVWSGINQGQPTSNISFPVTYNKAIWVNPYVSYSHGSAKIQLLSNEGFWVDFSLTKDDATLSWFAIGY